MSTDYYEVLGVDRTATKDDIKKAFRKKAHQFHPDKDGGDEEKFKHANEAYQVLSNDQKRAQYDQYGQTFDNAGANDQGFGGFNINVDDLGGVGDIFEQFFGGRSNAGQGRTGNSTSQRIRRGDDVGIDLTIAFTESASGVAKDITTRLWQTCSHCRGNGAEPGTPIHECATCQGIGTVKTTRQTMLGTFMQTAICHECQGDGKRAETVCTICRGEGRERRQQSLEIEIPAGIADGQTIRLSGKGEAPPRGGMAGDLYVKVHVEPHKILHRDGNNVRSVESLSFIDAALGTTRIITTLNGSHKLTIAPGTQPGAEYNIAGLGFPQLGGNVRGDHLVTINVEIPKKLTRQQKNLLEQFGATKKKGIFG